MEVLHLLLFFMALGLHCHGIMAAPLQPGSISGSINWWRDNSFNTPSSDYLYQSFRTKVFEPLITGILSDLKKLKERQVTSTDLGYGSLATAIAVFIGLILAFLKIKSLANKNIQRDIPPKQNDDNGRVL